MAKDKDGSRDGKEWGFVAYNVADAPKCIARCRRRFIEAILAASAPRKDYGDDETFDQVCETLSDKTQRDRKDQPFWDLYCCDAQLCGVNNVERLGEDRTSDYYPKHMTFPLRRTECGLPAHGCG